MFDRFTGRAFVLLMILLLIMVVLPSCSGTEEDPDSTPGTTSAPEPTPEPIPATGISISSKNNESEVYIGYDLQLYSDLIPKDSNVNVSWSVTPDTGEATISSDGLLTGTKLGMVTVTASVDDNSGIKESKKVKVRQLQYDGLWEGSHKIGTNNMSRPIGRYEDYSGYIWVALESGELDACEMQIASNFVGESTKSSKGTIFHEYPATWEFGFRLFEIDSSGKITGDALNSIDFEHTSISGAHHDDSRVIYTFDLSGVNIEKGKKYFFAIENLEDNPPRSFCSLNAYANANMSGDTIDIYLGSYPRMAGYKEKDGYQFDHQGLNGLGIRMANGHEYGGLEFDTTATAMRTKIGDMWHARQQLYKPYDRTVDAIALAVARTVTDPKGDLTIKIYGDDIDTVSFDIPAADIQHARHQGFGTITNQVFPLPSNVELSEDVKYYVELLSPDSTAGDYQIQGVRHSTGVMSRASRNTNIPQPADDVPFIEPNKSTGMAERSFQNGENWMQAGWSGSSGVIDFPIALRIVQE